VKKYWLKTQQRDNFLADDDDVNDEKVQISTANCNNNNNNNNLESNYLTSISSSRSWINSLFSMSPSRPRRSNGTWRNIVDFGRCSANTSSSENSNNSNLNTASRLNHMKPAANHNIAKIEALNSLNAELYIIEATAAK
jgi:hypothetical protein